MLGRLVIEPNSAPSTDSRRHTDRTRPPHDGPHSRPERRLVDLDRPGPIPDRQHRRDRHTTEDPTSVSALIDSSLVRFRLFSTPARLFATVRRRRRRASGDCPIGRVFDALLPRTASRSGPASGSPLPHRPRASASVSSIGRLGPPLLSASWPPGHLQSSPPRGDRSRPAPLYLVGSGNAAMERPGSSSSPTTNRDRSPPPTVGRMRSVGLRPAGGSGCRWSRAAGISLRPGFRYRCTTGCRIPGPPRRA